MHVHFPRPAVLPGGSPEERASLTQSWALRVDHLPANTSPAISAASFSCIAGMACE